MSENISFPTQGELVTYAFNAFGILPTKRTNDPHFTEEDKTSFQRLLARLAREEGKLQKNFKAALSTFDDRLACQLPDQNLRKVIRRVLGDLYLSYNRLFIEEGTYRPKHDTLLYFLLTRAASNLAEAVVFRSLRQQMPIRNALTEDNLALYLPDIAEDGQINWPLGKVMKSIYRQVGCSQIQFHCPGGPAESENPRHTQNLENAENWVRPEKPRIPSLPALLTNFYESLEAQDGLREVPKGLFTALPLLLTVARLSSRISRDIYEAYGPKLLKELTENVYLYFRSLDVEIEEFETQLKQAHDTDNLEELPDSLWQSALTHYIEHFLSKKQEARETLHRLQEASPSYPFKPPVIHSLSERLGIYPVFSCLDSITYSSNWSPSPDFVRFLNKGFELKGSSETTVSDIESFEENLRNAGIEDQLSWLPPWIRAMCFYRVECFEDAWVHMEKAYSLAKYRAGASQYLVVNQYLELCAKTNRRRQFKQGLDWATYAGIRVRWIRSEEQTEETVDQAFQILKMATYIV